MKYALFPGCVLKGAAAEAYTSLKKVCEVLSIEIEEIPEWTCCGASHAQAVDELTLLATNARNLSIAEHMGLPVLTVCNTCTLELKKAKAQLDGDAKLREKINGILAAAGHPYAYEGTAEITHFLWVLDAHPELLEGKISHALSGLKVAPFYGCHLLRPVRLMKHEDGRNPESMEKLIRLLGAECVDFAAYRLKCCGFHAFFTAERDVLTATGRIVDAAAKVGAAAIVTPCPLCQMQLDMYEPEAREAVKSNAELPVLHLQQLIGLALGFTRQEMGLERHVSGEGKLSV